MPSSDQVVASVNLDLLPFNFNMIKFSVLVPTYNNLDYLKIDTQGAELAFTYQSERLKGNVGVDMPYSTKTAYGKIDLKKYDLYGRDYSKFNAVYSKYFENDFAPARELVEVAALPAGVQVEISLIAGITK